jgi:hypothetical protein
MSLHFGDGVFAHFKATRRTNSPHHTQILCIKYTLRSSIYQKNSRLRLTKPKNSNIITLFGPNLVVMQTTISNGSSRSSKVGGDDCGLVVVVAFPIHFGL